MDDRANAVREDAPERSIAKMVDFRLPLYWLLSGCGALLWSLVSMWFSLQQIKEDMTQLKAATVVAAATTSELALLKFRLATLESDVNQIKAARNAR
jgi:hypothetical protein